MVRGSSSLPEVFTTAESHRKGEASLSSAHWLKHLAVSFKRNGGSQPAGVIWSLLGFWLLRSQTLVTHLHSGGELPDTVVVFVSESENNHLWAISLTSFIYRHHPVCPAVCLVASWLADRLIGCLISMRPGSSLTLLGTNGPQWCSLFNRLNDIILNTYLLSKSLLKRV